MLRTVLTICAVCAIGWGYGFIAGGAWGEDYSWFMMAVDAVACRVIVWRPAGDFQRFIGYTYYFQIALHAGRIIRGNEANLTFVYWAMTAIAFVQLFLVGGWWLHENVLRHRLLNRNSGVAAPPRRERA